MQPPRLTVIAHGKLSSQIYSVSFRSATLKPKLVQSLRQSTPPAHSNPLVCLAFGRSVGRCVFLLFKANGTRAYRLRNFDTGLRCSYRYELESDNRLESVANAHTAADLHVRPEPQTALVSRAVGAANVLRDTSSLVSRNENDSLRVSTKTTWHPPIQPATFVQSRKVLNLCTDSKWPVAVIFHAIAQNKFINCLRLNEAEGNF